MKNRIPLLRCTLWIFGGIVAVAGVALLAYSAWQYQTEGIEQTGITVCDAQTCLKTVHVHADIVPDLCGTLVTLPRESGPLNGLHTHKEKNYLHFHDRISLDPATMEELPELRLRVDEVLKVFELKLESHCPPNASMEVWINDAIAPEELQTQWKDGDDIVLRFSPS